MIYTISKIISLKLLEEYMPDRKKSFESKRNKILQWIKEGRLKAMGEKDKKKLITSEAIAMFKDTYK